MIILLHAHLALQTLFPEQDPLLLLHVAATPTTMEMPAAPRTVAQSARMPVSFLPKHQLLKPKQLIADAQLRPMPRIPLALSVDALTAQLARPLYLLVGIRTVIANSAIAPLVPMTIMVMVEHV